MFCVSYSELFLFLRETEVIENCYHKMNPSLVIDKSCLFRCHQQNKEQKDECAHHFLHSKPAQLKTIRKLFKSYTTIVIYTPTEDNPYKSTQKLCNPISKYKFNLSLLFVVKVYA